MSKTFFLFLLIFQCFLNDLATTKQPPQYEEYEDGEERPGETFFNPENNPKKNDKIGRTFHRWRSGKIFVLTGCTVVPLSITLRKVISDVLFTSKQKPPQNPPNFVDQFKLDKSIKKAFLIATTNSFVFIMDNKIYKNCKEESGLIKIEGTNFVVDKCNPTTQVCKKNSEDAPFETLDYVVSTDQEEARKHYQLKYYRICLQSILSTHEKLSSRRQLVGEITMQDWRDILKVPKLDLPKHIQQLAPILSFLKIEIKPLHFNHRFLEPIIDALLAKNDPTFSINELKDLIDPDFLDVIAQETGPLLKNCSEISTLHEELMKLLFVT